MIAALVLAVLVGAVSGGFCSEELEGLKCPLPTGRVNTAYSIPLCGMTLLSNVGVPPGLTFDSLERLLTGVPQQEGTFELHLGRLSGEFSCAITIDAQQIVDLFVGGNVTNSTLKVPNLLSVFGSVK